MRELLAELTFLTDVVEDAQFEENQEVLEVLMEDYTQLFELVMSRGLVVEDEEGMGSPQDLPSLPRDSPGVGKGGQLGKMTNLQEISKQKIGTGEYNYMNDFLGDEGEEEY